MKSFKTSDDLGDFSDNDKLIYQILADDEDLEEHISSLKLINHFQRYESSLRKFGVTPEELFEKLSIKNKKMENFEFLETQNKIRDYSN